MQVIAEIGLSLYALCVDFELALGRLLGLGYRDVNAGLFFVLWPMVTVALVLVVVLQGRTLRRLAALETARKGSKNARKPRP
jgi:hypothetical protein